MRRFARSLSSKRITQPTAPSGIPLSQIFQPIFPLPLRESVRQWTKRSQLREAEESLLDCVGLNPSSPSDLYKVQSLDVPVDILADSVNASKTNPRLCTMNELEVKKQSNSDNPEKHLIFLHGYGASKGYFYHNLKPLASMHTVHALDWLGYGLSTRATPRLPKFANLADGVLYGEDWFLTPFESWRKSRGLEKFTLVAHSLGAYLACAYASMHPHQVEKLVLVSPASVNRTSASIPVESLYSQCSEKEKRELASPFSGTTPQVSFWFKKLWERHFSPFSLVRNTGIYGAKMTSGWTSRRFSQQPIREQLALQDYSYRMFNAKGSGEYLLNYFLAAGGVGRWPLAERLKNIKCPSLWLYGEHDWMDLTGGKEAVKRLRRYGREADLEVIPQSGHHLYLDNQSSFNKAVRQFIQ